jgi:hypothetical protein
MCLPGQRLARSGFLSKKKIPVIDVKMLVFSQRRPAEAVTVAREA